MTDDHGLRHDLAIIERRRMLGWMASGGAALLAGCSRASALAAADCIAAPTETRGPYPADGSGWGRQVSNVLEHAGIIRSDIRSSLGSSAMAAGRAGAADADFGRCRRRLRALVGSSGLSLAVRSRRPLLALRSARAKLVARRSGHRRSRPGQLHHHLSGHLPRPLSAHAFRGFPECGRRHRRQQRHPRLAIDDAGSGQRADLCRGDRL